MGRYKILIGKINFFYYFYYLKIIHRPCIYICYDYQTNKSYLSLRPRNTDYFVGDKYFPKHKNFLVNKIKTFTIEINENEFIYNDKYREME